MNRDPALPVYDYDRIKEKLDNLLLAIANKLNREQLQRAKHPESQLILEGLARAATNTFNTIRFICAEEPPNHARKIEYVLNAPVLIRTIADVVATIVFLFQDLPARTAWYLKSGWKEFLEHRDRYRAEYDGDPFWTNYLDWLDRRVAHASGVAGITAAEAAKPSSVTRFPIPGQMKNDPHTAADRTQFLTYLYDWFYREFSQDTHLSWPGLVRRSTPLLEYPRSEQTGDYLEKLRSDAFSTSVTLLLCMLSELEIESRFGLADRIQFIWDELTPISIEAKELYDLRYAGRLTPQTGTHP